MTCHTKYNILHSVLPLHQSGQYIQTDCTHGYFNRNPFAVKCNSHVPYFIDRNANSTIH